MPAQFQHILDQNLKEKGKKYTIKSEKTSRRQSVRKTDVNRSQVCARPKFHCSFFVKVWSPLGTA